MMKIPFINVKKIYESELYKLLPTLSNSLPDGVNFEDSVWNLLEWDRHRGNKQSSNIIYNNYRNQELIEIIKLYVLYKRSIHKIGSKYADLVCRTGVAIDQILGSERTIFSLSNEDFINAQLLTIRDYSIGTAFRKCSFLQTFGIWLNEFLNLRITYRTSLKSPSYHGAKATDKGRNKKLIPTEVIKDLMAAINRKDLIVKDRFFLSALCFNVACGFRINELATLGLDCLIEEEGQTGIRYYPEKKGETSVRWIPSSLVPTVKKCYENIKVITDPAREIASAIVAKEGVQDWRNILKDKDASRYFLSKFVYEWVNNPQNNLLSKEGAWHESEKRYVDVLSVLKKNKNNVSASARELGCCRRTLTTLRDAQNSCINGKIPLQAKLHKARESWDTDTRMISFSRLEKTIGISLNQKKRHWLRDIMMNAQNCQLSNKSYLAPKKNLYLESKFLKKCIPALLVGSDKKPMLKAEGALFVLRKYELSQIRATKSQELSYITDGMFSRWLRGDLRSSGTGNDKDGCFKRLGIVDPRNGETAQFIWHDIRHWLNTIYQKGGMSESVISMVFGRKQNSNHIYDQTDMSTRVERLKESVRKGEVWGHLSSTFLNIAEYSREEAEVYLAAKVIMVNPMPHGLCTNNWSASACPHHLGCFTGDHEKSDGECEHLEVQLQDTHSIHEIQRLNREADIAVQVIPIQSPQHAHFVRLKKNTSQLLSQLDMGIEE